jgi:hypothetical protein
MSTKKTVAKMVLGSALTVGAISMSGCAAGKCGASGKCGSAKADTKTVKTTQA